MYLVTFFFFLKRLFVLLALDLKKKKSVTSGTGLEPKPKPTTLFWVWFGLDSTNYMDPNSSITKIP